MARARLGQSQVLGWSAAKSAGAWSKSLGVGLAFLVLGECSVDAGRARVAAIALAGGDDRIRAEHGRLMAGVRDAKSVLAAPHRGCLKRWP